MNRINKIKKDYQMHGTQFIQAIKGNKYTKNDDFKKIINALQSDKKLLSYLLNAISPILESANLKPDEIKKLLVSK
jgi:hypothetical protein